MKKLLSIIVPSYNMECYLDKCLSSVIIDDADLLQTLDVIVVNDGSTDRTSEIAHSYESKYPGVFRVIDKPNGHFGSCINAGLPLVQGTYVRIQDADDSFRVENFLDFVAYIKQMADTDLPDVVFNDVSGCTPDGKITDAKPHNFPVGRVFSISEIGSAFFGEGHFSIKTKIVRDLHYHQTEGCAYTDSEWYTWPFIDVATATYFPKPVTCVLNGRDGQSMNARMYARNFSTVAELVLGLAQKFVAAGAIGTAEGRQFVGTRIYGMVSNVYQTTILGYSGLLPECDLRRFDDKLQQIDKFLYLDVAKPVRIPHLPFKIDLINVWRRCRYRDNFVFVLIRFHQKVVRFLGKCKRMTRKILGGAP